MIPDRETFQRRLCEAVRREDLSEPEAGRLYAMHRRSVYSADELLARLEMFKARGVDLSSSRYDHRRDGGPAARRRRRPRPRSRPRR